MSAGGLSGVTECSVTGRIGRAVGGEGMLRAFKKGLREGGDGGVAELGGAEGRGEEGGRLNCLDGVKG